MALSQLKESVINMKLDCLESMVKDYELRTGERISFDGFYFDENGAYKDRYNEYFKFFPNKGFLFWKLIEFDGKRYFEILQTYGDMNVIGDYIVEVMELNGLTDIVTATTRNPKMHIRKWKMKRMPMHDYDYLGHHYYVLVGKIDALRKDSHV